MKPDSLKTKIFLDSGDPEETKQALDLLGFLDGQTTNPSLIAKSPKAQARLERGEKFTRDEVNEYYRETVTEISQLLPQASVSVEVYADQKSSANQLLNQALEMNAWIPNAHIKFPVTLGGLEAARQSIRMGMKVNMTLVFSEAQAAAVYVATMGAKKGDVFLSPFIGRLDDRGENGMDFIKNVIELYDTGDGHVEILAASVRNLQHLYGCLTAGVDIITAPLKVLEAWSKEGLRQPLPDYNYPAMGLRAIPKEDLGLNKPVEAYNIMHILTEQGLEKFVNDWETIIK